MILIKVECGNGVQDSIKECIKLAKKFEVGTTMDVNGVEVICMPWDSFHNIYKAYTQDLRNTNPTDC